ncbi:hypothetical protein D3C71_2212910 [compost metagenome]
MIIGRDGDGALADAEGAIGGRDQVIAIGESRSIDGVAANVFSRAARQYAA